METQRYYYFFLGKRFSANLFFDHWTRLNLFSMLFLIFLSACAYQPSVNNSFPKNQLQAKQNLEIEYLKKRKIDQALIDAMAAFLNQKYNDAIQFVSPVLRRNPVDANAHFINALSYHALALQERNYSYLDLADTGYALARKFNPNNNSVLFLHGATKYLQKKYRDAQEIFVLTALHEPDDWKNMYALSAASYQRNDIATALPAINQTTALNPPNDSIYRDAAIINAIAGRFNNAEINALKYNQSSSAHPSRIDSMNHIINKWRNRYNDKNLTIADLDASNILGDDAQEGISSDESSGGYGDSSYGTGNGDSDQQNKKDKKMILVDVILISSRERKYKNIGINLLNGLKLQYSHTPFSFTQSGSAARVINRSLDISIPNIIYSLNIFNHEFSNNRVLAKPTLIVTEGKSSEFFSGSVLHVELNPTASSLGGGSVEQIPIGLKLSVKGVVIDQDKVELDISISKASLDDRSERPNFNNFAQTTKTILSTTAILFYDQTLLLGGLTDYYSESLENKVPIIGDIPLINIFFNNSIDRGEQSSILILVTPRKPDTFTSASATPSTQDQSPPIRKFQSLYQVNVDPNFNSVIKIINENFLDGFHSSDIDARQNFIDINLLETELRKYIAHEL